MPKIQLPTVKPKRRPWNKRLMVGQKRPLLRKRVWALRARLELIPLPITLADAALSVEREDEIRDAL